MVERDASERPGVLLLRRGRAEVIHSARPQIRIAMRRWLE